MQASRPRASQGASGTLPLVLSPVHLASASGGHLDLLVRVREAVADRPRVWVTQPSERALALRREGEVVRLIPPHDRRLLSPEGLGNLRRSAGVVVRDRPRLVVTSGSGMIVPFVAMARARGARVVFVETTARVRSPSASGRVLSRLADEVLVQWPSMVDVYPNATVCRPPVLDAVAPGVPTRDGGTFVMVGTHVQPFDRLLQVVQRAARDGVLPEPLVVQTGASRLRLPEAAEARSLFSPDEVDAHVRASRVVICHAGTGSITTALRAGRRPIVIARRTGEHFDDHQGELAAEMEALGLAVPVDGELTAAAVARALQPLVPPPLPNLPPVGAALRETVLRVGA